METQEMVSSGVTIKVARNDGHILIDIRGPMGEPGCHGVVTPGHWGRFKRSIANAEKMMVKAGWLAENLPGPGRGSILQLVKSE